MGDSGGAATTPKKRVAKQVASDAATDDAARPTADEMSAEGTTRDAPEGSQSGSEG
jgi:hypothetical protein